MVLRDIAVDGQIHHAVITASNGIRFVCLYSIQILGIILQTLRHRRNIYRNWFGPFISRAKGFIGLCRSMLGFQIFPSGFMKGGTRLSKLELWIFITYDHIPADESCVRTSRDLI